MFARQLLPLLLVLQPLRFGRVRVGRLLRGLVGLPLLLRPLQPIGYDLVHHRLQLGRNRRLRRGRRAAGRARPIP